MTKPSKALEWDTLSFESGGKLYKGVYATADGCVTVRVTKPNGLFWENSTQTGGLPATSVARHLIQEITDGALTI